MGMQQLLLIVVVVIITGLAIYVGVALVRTYSETSNRDQLVSTLYDLGLMAQKYYKKPNEQGGGAGTFTGWSMPGQFDKTDEGVFNAVVRSERVDLSADGTQIGRNETTVVRVTARVDNDGIKITIVN